MTDKTALGDRMRRYEQPYALVLPRRTYTILRADGKAFHTLLRRADKPFDNFFMWVMADVAAMMCAQIQGCRFAYLQSDEISFLLTDFGEHGTEPWLGGVIQKMASVGAALATDFFNHSRTMGGSTWGTTGAGGLFDARVFTIPDSVEVANYFIWRQHDAVRNSVSMAAQAHFSHKSLQGLNSGQLQEKLWSEAQVNWNDYPAQAKRGAVCVRREHAAAVGQWQGIVPSRSQMERSTQEVIRHRWEIEAAPDFRVEAGSFLCEEIPPLPSLPRVTQEMIDRAMGRVPVPLREEAPQWHLEGKDGFDLAAESHPLGGPYLSHEAALEAAGERFAELSRLQPHAGGQDGIQDRVYLVHPDGRRERLFPGA